MSLPLIINPIAEADLQAAKAWYEAQRAGLGDEFIECVDEALAQIEQFPRAAPKVFSELRRKLVQRFPYGVFFRIDDDQITVVAVYHSKRDPRGWQKRVDDV